MGMLRRQTRGLLIAEAILIGFIAVLAGIVIGAREGQLILSHVNVAQSGRRFPFHFPVGSAIEAGVTIVLATAVAAWYPARATAQLKITEALEYE
jgi:ABC-type antimicrobial peptide transport system permease subunit